MQLKSVLDNNIQKLNQDNYKTLKEKVKQDKVTWILGAGISVPAGLPDWNLLLTKMWARLSEIDPSSNSEMESSFFIARQARLNQITDYAKFRTKIADAYEGRCENIFSEINVLESAEYMSKYIMDLIDRDLDDDAKEKLHKQILKELIRDSLSISKKGDELAATLSNQAVGYLSKLLKSKNGGTIITYNYDDILEFCIEKIGHANESEINIICDCDSDKKGEVGKINIHHPHGALNVANSLSGKESNDIILNEKSYYNLEQKAYIWENSVQAKALIETTCVFIGFSGDDYNFRRIIKNINPKQNREETSKHYIFICLDKLIHKICKNLAEWENEEYIYENLQLINILYAQYSYWDNRGIIPIWSTFEELPNMIRDLL